MNRKKESENKKEEIEITPLKDFEIHHNKHNIVLKAGEPVTIPRLFLQNLVTEKVIKTILK